jgi:hypothetical protein
MGFLIEYRYMRTAIKATETASSNWISLGSRRRNMANQGIDRAKTIKKDFAATRNLTRDRTKEPTPTQITTSHVRRKAPAKPSGIKKGIRIKNRTKPTIIREKPTTLLSGDIPLWLKCVPLQDHPSHMLKHSSNYAH